MTISTPPTRYVHNPLGGNLSQHDAAGAWHWALVDGLGSVRGMVDEAFGVEGSRGFAPYGLPMDGAGSVTLPFAFTGEPRDGNGLQYHRARYYHPRVGVFASLDPLEVGNRYVYVGGNVVNRVDPSGMVGELPAGVAGDCLPVEPCKCCGPDATKWIFDEMKLHARYASSWGLHLTPPDVGMGLPIGLDRIFDRVVQDILSINLGFSLYHLAVYGLAVNYGEIDYITLANSPNDIFSCSQSSVIKTISVCGRCHNSTDFGNFILGIVIERANGPRVVAELAGSIFNQLSGDTSASSDNLGVTAGFDFAQGFVFGEVFDRRDFCQSLLEQNDTWLESLKGCSRENACLSPYEPNLDHANHSVPSWNRFVNKDLPQSISKEYDTPRDWLINLLTKYAESKALEMVSDFIPYMPLTPIGPPIRMFP